MTHNQEFAHVYGLAANAETLPINVGGEWDWLWQGALLVLLGMFVTSIFSFIKKTAPASFQNHVQTWKARQYIFRAQLNSSSDTIRQDAANRIVFNVLRNLLMSLSFWIASEMMRYGFSRFSVDYIALAFNVISAFFLIISMRWIGVFYVCESMSDDAIKEVLIDNEWSMCFRPPDGKKRISFKENGEVGRGKNNNEHKWSVNDGVLEIFTDKDIIHNKFWYSPAKSKFLAVDSPDIRAFLGQYIELVAI